MNRRDIVRLQQTDANRILADLTGRQHLRPHRPLGEALAAAAADLGFCPGAAETAIGWLQLDPAGAIGRLKHAELIQLARSIHRFWRQSLTTPASEPAHG